MEQGVEGYWLLAEAVEIKGIHHTDNQWMIEAKTIGNKARCPSCGQASERVHSYYRRTLRDVPWGGEPVQLQLNVRRFRCQNALCPCVTFAERLPAVVGWHKQRTVRLTTSLVHLVMTMSAEAGARLLPHLGMKTSADTLLRILRQQVPPQVEPPRVIGVDDWALRKGAVYGTLLVDLERHRPLELLPDRTSASLATWLKQYPSIEIITRDRAGAYAEGARLGAPQALQIADRWHLLKNLQDCLAACFEGFQLPLHPNAVQPTDIPLRSSLATDTPVRRSPARLPHPLTQMRQQRRAHWQGIFEQVHHLAAAGSSNRAIARQLHISLKTVRKYRRLPTLPRKTSPKTAPRLLDAYQPYLRQRLLVENISARQMWEELCAQGFRGGKTAVYLGVAQLRRELGLLPFRRRSTSPPPVMLNDTLTPRTLAAWVLRDATQCTLAETAAIQQASLLHPNLATAIFLGAAFADHLRHRNAPALNDWLRQAIASGIDSLMAFALSLQRDYEAVRAAFSHEWSSGQVEGQVNRLKLIKRQMYGRANFDLLRLRVLFHDP